MEAQEIIVNLPPPDAIAQWVAITQIVANVAVIVAIIVAIMQFRSSKLSASSSAEQFHTQVMNDFWMTLASDVELASVYRKGRKDPKTLDEEQKTRFFYTCVSWFSLQETMYVQAADNHVTDRYYRDWVAALKDDLQDTGFQEYWAEEREFFDEEFRNFVDSAIASHKGAVR